MADLKTAKNDDSVAAFLSSIRDEAQRRDALVVMGLMEKATGAPPAMWGKSIVGFGTYKCKYASGREVDWFVCGLSPRKANLSIYLSAGFDEMSALLSRLGKHTTGKSCLYVKRLSDIDQNVLTQLIRDAVKRIKAKTTE